MTAPRTPGDGYHGRTDLTGTAQTIDFGGTFRNVAFHLDAGSADVHYRLNPVGVTVEASEADRKIDDSFTFEDTFNPGVEALYIYSTAANGTIDVEAW